MQNTDKAKVMKAMELLDQAGAVYKIWTDEDVRDVARNLVEVLGMDDAQEDAIVHRTSITVLSDATKQDAENITRAVLGSLDAVQDSLILGAEVPC